MALKINGIKSLKIQENVHRTGCRIGLEPVTHFGVVQRQVLEDNLVMSFHVREELFKDFFVEDLALFYRPRLADQTLGSERDSRHKHGVKTVGDALLNADGIKNCVAIIVKEGYRRDYSSLMRCQAPSMATPFATSPGFRPSTPVSVIEEIVALPLNSAPFQ
jgi:hypothetical protein